MMNLKPRVNLVFDHTYECKVVSETSGLEAKRIFYPGPDIEVGHDGLTVNIAPFGGTPWVATFKFGQLSPNGVSGIFSMPNSERICVVSRGDGYVVSANDPCEWEIINAIPVIDVRCSIKHKIILFANFTELVAYDSVGLKWRTDRLTWDNMKLVEMTDDAVTGEFWDIRTESDNRFTVELATGKHHGGIDDA
jgi:hypothetical protein